MTETRYRARRSAQIENGNLRVTVTAEGGHVAEIFHKEAGVSPLWNPPWPTIEPSAYDPAKHPEYGADAESKLLAGILGHNLCLDLIGFPSPEEIAAGMTVHGEGAIARYQFTGTGGELVAAADLPQAQLRFERRLRLAENSSVVAFTETVENLTAWDRPVAWTEHPTLGPPYLERGSTLFRTSATRSMVWETPYGKCGRMVPGAEFEWPHAPLTSGGTEDLRVFTRLEVGETFTTHLMNPEREQAFFMAWTPASSLLFGYVWKQSDFPWMGIWEENHARTHRPWNGQTLTRGMEFGVSPWPEGRRKMIERGSMFGVPGFRWIPARTRVRVDYCAFLLSAPAIQEEVKWDGGDGITFS